MSGQPRNAQKTDIAMPRFSEPSCYDQEGTSMYGRALETRAFADWFSPSSALFQHETQMTKHEPSRQRSRTPLSDLHRIFWAIRTKRFHLVHTFWSYSTSPLVSAFFIQYAAREHVDDATTREELISTYDAVCSAILKNYAHKCRGDGSRFNCMKELQTAMCFLATEEEHDIFLQMTAEQQQQNRAVRAGLTLMGFAGCDHVTILDLAERARSTAALKEECTYQVLRS